jgi:hypothetical protein
MRSEMAVILSDTRLATYDPVDVRLSAPMTTPPSKLTAMMVVCGERERRVGKVRERRRSWWSRLIRHV